MTIGVTEKEYCLPIRDGYAYSATYNEKGRQCRPVCTILMIFRSVT